MKRYIKSSTMLVYDDENGKEVPLSRTNRIYTLSKTYPFAIVSKGSRSIYEKFEDYESFCQELKYLVGDNDVYEKLSTFEFSNQDISKDGNDAILVSNYQKYSTYCYLDKLLEIPGNGPMYHNLLDKDYSFIQFPLSYTLHEHTIEV